MGGLPETYCRHFLLRRGMAAFCRFRSSFNDVQDERILPIPPILNWGRPFRSSGTGRPIRSSGTSLKDEHR